MSKMSVVLAVLTLTPMLAAAAPPCPTADSLQAPKVIDGKFAACDFDSKTCWLVDGDKWIAQPQVAEATVDVTATAITTCKPGGKVCVTIETNAFPNGGRGVASDDGALVAAYAGPKLEIYDPTTKKRVTRIASWATPMGPAKDAQFQAVKFAGKTLIVWESETPVSSSARLYGVRNGKKLAEVVRAHIEVAETAEHIDRDVYALVGFQPKLYLINVATGKTTKTYALDGGADGRFIMGKLGDGRIAISSSGSTTLVDPATGKATVMTPPACKP